MIDDNDYDNDDDNDDDYDDDNDDDHDDDNDDDDVSNQGWLYHIISYIVKSGWVQQLCMIIFIETIRMIKIFIETIRMIK